MAIRHAIWTVSAKPSQLASATLASEQQLESMIIAAPEILSPEWMLIGRQVDTGFGGRIDLLAIAPDGALVLIEIKRDRTPREVVAQALDYACWVDRLRAEDIVAIYQRFAPEHSLAQDFRARFGQPLDEEQLNQSHQIVIVAAALDESSERIVGYLSERNIPINVLFFSVFAHGPDQLLSRAWLLDPVQVQANVIAKSDEPKEPWNGEFYVSFGDADGERSWRDAVEYGFVAAGGGPWYSKTLNLLNPGDRIWVKIPSTGFVGVGIVRSRPEPAASFLVATPEGERPVLEVAKRAHYNRELLNDPERCDYFIAVDWLQTVPREQGVREIGMFGNQNTVCRPSTPKWRHTVERLKVHFPKWDARDSA